MFNVVNMSLVMCLLGYFQMKLYSETFSYMESHLILRVLF